MCVCVAEKQYVFWAYVTTECVHKHTHVYVRAPLVSLSPCGVKTYMGTKASQEVETSARTQSQEESALNDNHTKPLEEVDPSKGVG